MHINILKGLATSYIFTFVSFLIFSVLLSFTNIPDSSIPNIILVISILGILIGSATCTRFAHSQGLLWGAVVGLLYSLLLYLLSSILLVGFSSGMSTIYLVICSALFGSIGGVVGINLKSNSKHWFIRLQYMSFRDNIYS